MENKRNEQFYFNELVDVVLPLNNCVIEGKVTSIRGQFLSIQVDGKESIYKLSDNLVLKKWKEGRQLLQFNRVDIKSDKNKLYYEGYIRQVNSDGVYVAYKQNDEEEIEFVSNELISKKIVEVGKFSSVFNPNVHQTSDVFNLLYKNKPIYKPNEEKSKQIESKLKEKFLIYEVGSDGNCLYRSLAHQIYGNENLYNIVKETILDYIEIEEDFFSSFITGDIKQYINMKRYDGVWGDDIELQACSEIYLRPISIFIDSVKPLKTFHEESESINRNRKNSDFSEKNPLYLSYHGFKHYNSLIPQDIEIFKKNLLTSIPGEFEREVLNKIKNTRVKHFFRHESLDKLLIIGSNESTDNAKVNNIKHIEEKKDYEYDVNETDDEYIVKQVIEESKNNNINSNNDNFEDAIRFILDNGFTEEEAVMAFTAVGSDPDLMLQYLYSRFYK